jgi:SAM-dependent methyltransferase
MTERSCLFVNTYYPAFLRHIYGANPSLAEADYATQHKVLLEQFFGDGDFYSQGLRRIGWDAGDLIVNCEPLQQAWAIEHAPHANGLEIAAEQIRSRKPDVVYFQDLSLASSDFLKAIRASVGLVVGQVGCRVSPNASLGDLDLVITSFPHYVERFRSTGLQAFYQPLAFDPRVLQRISNAPREYDVSFVGGFSKEHSDRQQFLEQLWHLLPFDVWGYGIDMLSPQSPLRRRHHGGCWGLDMFSTLSRSTISINTHAGWAENYANNMRLYEATGCGSLLLTEYMENLDDLFEVGEEVVAYRSAEECAALVHYYLDHPEEADAIRLAGQRRTLSEHTYALRMEETSEIFDRAFSRAEQRGPYMITPEEISSTKIPISVSEVTPAHRRAWMSGSIPEKQRSLVSEELKQMYRGAPIDVFGVLAKAVRPYVRRGSSVLELGCASGYYFEVLEYVLATRIAYTGVDYSSAMTRMGREYYPRARFLTADATHLPFPDGSFSLVITSAVLMHVPEWAEQAAEAARVSSGILIAHRTPICRTGPTCWFRKRAYGVETVELRFNERELLNVFAACGFELLDTSQYWARPDADEFEVTYVLRKLRGAGAA